jgi:hypothetical protein
VGKLKRSTKNDETKNESINLCGGGLNAPHNSNSGRISIKKKKNRRKMNEMSMNYYGDWIDVRQIIKNSDPLFRSCRESFCFCCLAKTYYEDSLCVGRPGIDDICCMNCLKAYLINGITGVYALEFQQNGSVHCCCTNHFISEVEVTSILKSDPRFLHLYRMTLNRSALVLCRRNPLANTFVYCPTFDCGNRFVVRMQHGQSSCTKCQALFCTTCFEGITKNHSCYQVFSINLLCLLTRIAGPSGCVEV